MTKGGRLFLGFVGVLILGALAYFFMPTQVAKVTDYLNPIEVSGDEINNIDDASELPIFKNQTSSSFKQSNAIKGGMYAWTGEFALLAANGGKQTKKGSLMEQEKVSVQITRQDMYDDLINGLVLATDDYSQGAKYARNQKAFDFVVAMGDGSPFFISTCQNKIDEKHGEGKYTVQASAVIGVSNGEDKLIAPYEWVNNPQLAIGKTVSVVVGDGDFILLLNWCALNNIPVNPNFGTWDETKLNIWNSKDYDYIESAKELIQSQINGQLFDMRTIKNGEITEKIVQKKIDACATWSPADELAFSKLASRGFVDVISTKELRNQMPTTIFTIKEWTEKNSDEYERMLSAIYIAANQIKQYPSWLDAASNAAADVFGEKPPSFWKKIYESYPMKGSARDVSIGGSRVFNLADAKEYLGLDKKGVDKMEIVYTQVNTFIDNMKMRDDIKKSVPYSQAINKSYVSSINNINEGEADVLDYGRTATTVVTKGNFNIEFALNSSQILDFEDLETLRNVLIQADGTKIILIGHTDSSGSSSVNYPLSENRAKAVANYLMENGIPYSRIQDVSGVGSQKPIAPNTTAEGRAKNRRVEVKILN